MEPTTRPGRAGLYDPSYEHDACGVAFVAQLVGPPSHGVVERALVALANLEHRGAAGADPDTGDGAGILIQIPDKFLRSAFDAVLPELGSYAVGQLFLPRDEKRRAEIEQLVEKTISDEGQTVLGWRTVPIDRRHCGETALASAPAIRQVLIGAAVDVADQDEFERRLYVIRRLIEKEVGEDAAIPSLSSRTIVYKGMLTSPQLPGFFPDLRDPLMETKLAVVHSRFSTNTFPSWELAHPYRMIAHNGEINTLRGNVNWMRARESQMESDLFAGDIAKVLPAVRPGGSDSASLDNVFELLVHSGRSLPHAAMMMIPEAYKGNDRVTEEVEAFYDFHGSMIEPWDGPAAVVFTDGRSIGATLDRNGLRPGRWAQTSDGMVVMASEAGVLPVEPEHIVRKGRLEPGRLFMVDVDAGRIVEDDEVKSAVAGAKPYGDWLEECTIALEDLPEKEPNLPREEALRMRQLAFGYTQEDMRLVIAPMAAAGEEPTASMGNDASLAVLSDRQPLLFGYFKQLFAQVTNPPIDPIREAVVMSLSSAVGSEGNLLEDGPAHAHQILLQQPILRNAELEKIRQIDRDHFNSAVLDTTWQVWEGKAGLGARLETLCAEADAAIAGGANILILSDRAVGADRVPIPSLLATSAIHHHLVRSGTRLRTGLVVETGEPRGVHDMATLIGFGAAAVNPYLMFESIDELSDRSLLPVDLSQEEAEKRIVKAIGKGLLKTMSKMGISTISSYCGAQIFEAVGLDEELVDKHFTGTASRIGGIGLDVLAEEALERHFRAWPSSDREQLPVGGFLQWRKEGEHHVWNPDSIAKLQHAVNAEGDDGLATYREWAAHVNGESSRRALLRGLLRLKSTGETVPLDEVEPATEIVKRFATGAMSLGSISPESHESLAIAMNRIGGKSNTGEGGEDPKRFVRDESGDLRRSSIKQVASGRFGVTAHYLANADQIQIKMAQGAKPGEGGQLPGHKVDDYIAYLRHSTTGVGLISPPPHHDIYSIEDLKQLIYDLRCANPDAEISVKLVSEVGVGTVAAGVAKANSDHIVIAGYDGGTGASPQSSIHSAGLPWEVGIAETQQTLLANDLRSRVVLQVDGQMKTGRDVVIAALLGADEMGFSTAPLIAMGCILMRVCHLNTCPVGIATQDPELRRRFRGTPEHVVKYLFWVAEEVRELMASLGVRTFDEMIGRVDLLEMDPAIDHWKAKGVDLSRVLAKPEVEAGAPLHRVRGQDPVLGDALDWEITAAAAPALERGERVRLDRRVRNVNRTVGGILSGQVARRHGSEGLAEGLIEVHFKGSAGQSFGAWLAKGVSFDLEGETNDYTGKGLSGGLLTVRPPEGAGYLAEESVIIGNTALYGATSGRAYFRGLAGERFAVRNSGATAVVEGVGDHGCEYMTGGRVAVLGLTGRNFAAGMSGGVAYVLDVDGTFASRCNPELVDLDPVGEHDEAELHAMVSEHAERTGSAVARRLLAGWESSIGSFIKVMPRDYKRAIAEKAAAGTQLDGVKADG
jgi:glutamate synthase domain-containing protein 2/glutamate synthase domain-containing protein 1/glutamate synthase domain-containing protein 3